MLANTGVLIAKKSHCPFFEQALRYWTCNILLPLIATHCFIEMTPMHPSNLGATYIDVLRALNIDPSALAARGLWPHEEAPQDALEWVATHDDGREFKLTHEAAQAWRLMQAAAREDGIALLVLSAYRSVARQVEIIERHLANGESIADILQSVAPPGYSEHHTGRAIDIGSSDHPKIEETFASTAAFAWLTANAARFGFTMSYPKGNASGYVYEPWHWCWQPPADA